MFRILNYFRVVTLAAPLLASGALLQQHTSQQISVDTPASNRTEVEKLGALDNDVLIERRDTLQSQISELTPQLAYLRDIRAYLTSLETAKTQNDKAELERKIAETEPWAGVDPGEGHKMKSVVSAIAKNELDFNIKTQTLAGINTEISRRLNREGRNQDFKTLMSAFFAGIVALVVIGFFLIAYSSSKVKEEIFAGQAGLQFITLFSLVIAIILFGITGVLEGKELAALLGGLAGYILGRSGGSAPISVAGSASSAKPGAVGTEIASETIRDPSAVHAA